VASFNKVVREAAVAAEAPALPPRVSKVKPLLFGGVVVQRDRVLAELLFGWIGRGDMPFGRCLGALEALKCYNGGAMMLQGAYQLEDGDLGHASSMKERYLMI
jgi:hypothetical protein